MTSTDLRFSAESPRDTAAAERWALVIVAAMAVLRLTVTGTAPLSSDEAYYWQWTRPLALSYYDHPPMVAYWIWVGVHLLGDTTLGTRLPAVLGSLAVTALAWDIARRVFGSRRTAALCAIWISAILLFESAGVIITPDTPLIFSWSLCLWALTRLVEDGRARWILLAGVALGLGALSKYTMALIGPGIVAAFLAFPTLRPWWRRPASWIAVMIAALLASPVVIWNATHQWASFHKQFSHAFDDQATKSSLAPFLSGQIGVVTPLIFGFCLFGMVWALVQGWRHRRADIFLLGATSLPLLAFFTYHAASSNVQAHWAGPAYIGATIAAVGGFLSAPRPAWARGLFRAAPVLGLALSVLALVHAATAILPLPTKIDPMKRLGGWDTLAAAVAEERAAHPGAFLFTAKHDPTGPVSFHLADHPPVFLEGAIRPSYYTAAEVAALKGKDGIFITRSRLNDADSQKAWCADITLLSHVEMRWRGRVADAYDLYLCRDYQGGAFVMGDGLRGETDKPLPQ